MQDVAKLLESIVTFISVHRVDIGKVIKICRLSKKYDITKVFVSWRKRRFSKRKQIPLRLIDK